MKVIKILHFNYVTKLHVFHYPPTLNTSNYKITYKDELKSYLSGSKIPLNSSNAFNI